MDETRDLLRMLHVGDIYVSVGYALGGEGLKAETDDAVMGASYLGGTIAVETLELAADSVDATGDYPEASVSEWADLLVRMRDMLARCFVFGTMRPGYYAGDMGGADGQKLDAAIEELGEDFFVIGSADAHAAVLKQEARDEAERGFWRAALRAAEEKAEREGLSEEENNLTIGDIMDVREVKDEEEGR